GGGSSTTEAFGAATTDSDVIKVSDIGFVTTASQNTTLNFTATVIDADGDKVTAPVFTVGPAFTAPVVLDLNGDGLHFLSQAAGVSFDYNGDGQALSTAWASPQDGILVFDANGDGKADNGSEIVFSGYVAGATTDLQGLAA